MRADAISFRGTRSYFTRLLLGSILLFAAGPPLGSMDADQDGSPEVPIIVLNLGSAVILARHVSNHKRPSIISHIQSLLLLLLPSEYPSIEKQFNSSLGHTTLLSLGLLRC